MDKDTPEALRQEIDELKRGLVMVHTCIEELYAAHTIKEAQLIILGKHLGLTESEGRAIHDLAVEQARAVLPHLSKAFDRITGKREKEATP